MKRRKFLIGVGSASIGGSALIGTGAFSRVDAQRSVTVDIAEDPNAYLGLGKCNTPNGSYAHLDDDGHLKIFMDDENPTIGDPDAVNPDLGTGVNSDSTSVFDRVFRICNQGKQDVCVHIEDNQNWPTVPTGSDIPDDAEGERRVEFYLENDDTTSLIGQDNSIQVPLGDCFCVGMKVRSYGLSEGDEVLADLDEEIRIIADVDGECVDTVCGVVGQFDCVERSGGGENEIIGHNFIIENVGDIGVTQDLEYVILDSPDQDDFAFDLDPLAPGGTDTEVGDSAFPVAGVLAYVPPEECDEVIGQQRDNWNGFDDSDLLQLPEDTDGTIRYDLVSGLRPPGTNGSNDPGRYAEIQNVSSYSELVAAFNDGTSNPDPELPQEAYLTTIDYSGYNLDAVATDDINQDDTATFEERLLNSSAIPKCDGS